MHYSKHYSKLDDKIHTTIRRRKKGKEIGYIVPEYVDGKFISYVEVLMIWRYILSQIPIPLLLKDTDCETPQEAIELIQSFYLKPIEETEKLYIFKLRKVEVIK